MVTLNISEHDVDHKSIDCCGFQKIKEGLHGEIMQLVKSQIEALHCGGRGLLEGKGESSEKLKHQCCGGDFGQSVLSDARK